MNQPPDNRDEFFNSIEKLRQRLLDLSGRNNFISFRHSNRSKKQIRFIDENPDVIFKRLLDETTFEISGIPVPDLEPEDEKNKKFKHQLERAKESDPTYLADLGELGPAPASRKLQKIENDLRDRLRVALEMPPVERNKRPQLAEAAKKLGIEPSLDLVFDSSAKKHNDNKIQTLYYEDELEAMLSKVNEQRKLFETETGTEPLYLAFGFLEWYESESSDKHIHSPLIFIPVNLERIKDATKREKDDGDDEDGNSSSSKGKTPNEAKISFKYVLKLRENEAFFNFSLKERLFRDFSIVLPELAYSTEDGEQYFTPSEYYQKVASAIIDQKNWEIKNWSTLSFFSFSKLAMYQELEREKFQSICSDETPIEDLIYGVQSSDQIRMFETDYDVEKEEVKEKVPYLVSIADTSQISSIIDAIEGKNLVIEGPPGTGKSQTITNMIAALIGRGKKVLFIAEKKAALTVVKERLESCGLGPFCLELHSGKSKKTEVLSSIKDRLEIRKKKVPGSLLETTKSIELLKSKISNYLTFLNKEYEPLSVSLQEIMWRLLNIKYSNFHLDKIVNLCEIPYCKELNKWEIERLEMALNTLTAEFRAHIEKYGTVDSHPWHQMVDPNIQSINIAQYVHELKVSNSQIEAILTGLNTVSNSLASDLSVETFTEKLYELYKLIKDLEGCNFDWMHELLIKLDSKTQEGIETAFEAHIKREKLFAELSESLDAKQFRTLSIPEFEKMAEQISSQNLGDKNKSSFTQYRHEINEKREKIKPNLESTKQSAKLNSERLFEERHNFLKKQLEVNSLRASEHNRIVNESLLILTELTSILESSYNLTVKQFNDLPELKTLIDLCPIESWDLRNSSFLDSSLRNAFLKNLKIATDLEVSKKKLKSRIRLDSIHSIYELRSVYKNLKNSGFFSFFSGDYRKSKKLATELIYVKDTNQNMADLVLQLIDYLEQIESFEAILKVNPLFLKYLGPKSGTDLDVLSRWMTFYEKFEQFSILELYPSEILSKILDLDSNMILKFKQKLGGKSKISESICIEYALNENVAVVDLKQHVANKSQKNSGQLQNQINNLKSNFEVQLKNEILHLEKDAESIESDLTKRIQISSILSEFFNRVGIYESCKLSSILTIPNLLRELIKFDDLVSESQNKFILSEAKSAEVSISSSEIQKIRSFFKLMKSLNRNPEKAALTLKNGWDLWVAESATSIEEAIASFPDFISIQKRWPKSFEKNNGISIRSLRDKINMALNVSDDMQGYIDYLRSYNELGTYSKFLVPFLECASKNTPLMAELLPGFRIAFYTSIIKSFSSESPEHFKSVSTVFDSFRENFKKLDYELSEIYKVSLYNELTSKLSIPGNSRGKKSDFTEQSLLEYQIGLKRPSASVRKLMSKASKSMQALKPVFLMSPLSVAQLLPEREIQFDVVIMDEASQMKPQDALGSIARAKQVVIVGDPKQMPPSDFFNRSANIEDNSFKEDEDFVEVEEESILDLGMNAFRPARRLRWHYRSRSEKLIAFSNHHFYEGDLIIFPSSYNSNVPMGVKYNEVKGVYNKGTNPIEATEAINLVVKLIHENPTKTIMVVAMNQAQSDLMQEIFNEKEKNDFVIAEYRAKFEESLEPFLIRNLENVQGDERDIVVISTVYGPDSNGHVFQRFGPINSEYGHRRLNVLFTRAKYCMVVVSSIDPEKIVVSTSSKPGVAAFKNFLSYAKYGRLGAEIIEAGQREPDSDFEIFVAKRLKEKMPHLHIVPQVGVAGFFIDMAVRHPTKEGAFLLGIECDGKTYHSAKSARDRDKIRQKVLEDLGWNLHRIWSTDWFNNPENEVKKLVEKIKYLTK